MAVMAIMAVPLLLAGCTAVQNAVQNVADSIQRNFKLRQSGYGLSLKDGLTVLAKEPT